MSHRLRAHSLGWLLPLGLCLGTPLAAQQVAPADAPKQWQADAKANKQAQKAAEKQAEADKPPRKGGAGKPPEGAGPPQGGRGGPPGGGEGGGPPGDGMGGMGGDMPGGLGGHGRGPGGHGGKGHHGEGGGAGGGGSPAAMLRPEMDFAAPLDDTLILYRSREAVVFGRKASQDVVILPLSGAAVDVAPGVQATLHEDAHGLRVEVATSNDIHVTYRYTADADGALRVGVHAEGPVPHPGSRFDVERVYRAGAAR